MILKPSFALVLFTLLANIAEHRPRVKFILSSFGWSIPSRVWHCRIVVISLLPIYSMKGGVFRLGAIRRNERDYSLLQRSTGKFASHRLVERCLLQSSIVLLLQARRLRRRGALLRARPTRGISLVLLAQLLQLRKPRLLVPDNITKRTITIDQHSVQKSIEMYGFVAGLSLL